MIKLALLTQSFINVFRRKNFFYKLFNSFLAFFLIFSLAFVTIETIDPEPVFAASWDCFDSSGRPIAFQTKYSSGSLQVKRYNFSTNTENTTTFSSGFSGSGEINASFMDLDGNLYVQRKKTGSNGTTSRMYLVNPTGSPTLVSSNYTGTNLNAATFFVDNGYEYAIYSKGHFSSGGGFARFASNSDTSLAKTGGFSTSYTGSYNPVRSNAKDFAWIQDNSSFPSVSGSNKPDFIGVDGANQKIYASYYTISNQGTSSESIAIVTKAYSVSIPSADRDAFGAIYGFGGDELYVANNDSGNIYKITTNGSSYSMTDTGDNIASSNNNDGAACHRGSPDTTFNPSVTATQGSCDGSNREIDVTLNNSSSNKAVNFVVTYTVNGGSSTSLTTGTSVSSSSTNTSLSVPGQANSASVVISWYAEYTTENLREPESGTTSLSSITIDASSCTTGSVSATTSLGSCSSGSATSSITITASDATMYVDVQYKIGSGSWVTLEDGNSIAAGGGNAETYTIPTAQSHGTTIYWQYRADSSGNPSSGSYTSATSRTVSCPTYTFTTSTSAGSCSNGSSTPSITVNNTG